MQKRVSGTVELFLREEKFRKPAIAYPTEKDMKLIERSFHRSRGYRLNSCSCLSRSFGRASSALPHVRQ
jgi:hypothetical protein